MFGEGILKGLGITLKRTIGTFTYRNSRYEGSVETSKGKILRQPTDAKGLFTIQYPEERRELPENFRYIPMLIYEEDTGEDRCTACGICAKVCPPQCIWIVRDKDETGKPITRPSQFYIDASICMSCGYCSEYCPFDAIKMNHDYELATYDRFPGLVYDKAELSVPTSYYAALYPSAWAIEEAERAKKAAKKAAKAPPASKAPAAVPTPEPQPAVSAAPEPAAAPAPRPQTKGKHGSPIPEGYTGALVTSTLPLPPVPAEGVSPSGVAWQRVMELREQQLQSYRARRKAEGKDIKL